VSITLRRVCAMTAGLAALAGAGAACAQGDVCHGAPTANRLLIQIEGVKSSQGQIAVSIYDSKAGFLKREMVNTYDPAKVGVTTVCVSLPHPGEYAVVAYHDANANRDLDQGLLGIPKEGYGFSNNVRPVLSAPSFAAAGFNAGPGDTNVAIQLHYPAF
jgi:uncharacterized protein (DUF2141 family)